MREPIIQSIDLSETPSFKQLVYDNLLRQIISGELPPNSRLMEAEISKAMNVSRAPIREALTMLERDGFTKIVPHKGSVVAEVTMKNVNEVWEIRCVLEPYAAKESCRLIPEDRLLSIRQSLEELEVNLDSFEKYVKTDYAVHNILFEFCQNDYLRNILENLKAHSARMRWITERQMSSPGMCIESILEHKQIINTLLQGNEDDVYVAVYQHLVKSRKRLIEAISSVE